MIEAAFEKRFWVVKALSFLLPLLSAISLSAQTPAPPVTLDASKFSSLQAALDAVPPSGGVVVIPPGNHEITQPLRIRTAETRITGSGAATHVINKNDNGQPAFLLRPPTLDTDKQARLWRVQMADLRISGNEKSGDGILAEGIQEIYLEGVSVDHHGGHGIHLRSCFEDPRIADCIITYNKKSGIEIFDCHDIVVSANHFEENQDALRCVDSFNLCMNGNNIDDHLGNGIIVENTYGSVVSGNMIEECNGTAMILDRDCYGITLSANVIAHHLKGGIDLRDACGCTLSANTFTIVHEFSVRVGTQSERNTLSGNTFCNTYIGAGQDKRPKEAKLPMGTDEGSGVELEAGVNGLLINGNMFSGLSTAAVWTSGEVKNVLISSNICVDCCRKLAKGSDCIPPEKEKSLHLKDNLIVEETAALPTRTDARRPTPSK